MEKKIGVHPNHPFISIVIVHYQPSIWGSSTLKMETRICTRPVSRLQAFFLCDEEAFLANENRSMPQQCTGNQNLCKSGWWFQHPSEKYEFVNWDEDIPNRWENKIHVPNHPPENLCKYM